MMHHQNSWTRIHINVSHKSTPETWMIIVVGPVIFATSAMAWPNIATRKINVLGPRSKKGLVMKPWYLIPIEDNSNMVMQMYRLLGVTNLQISWRHGRWQGCHTRRSYLALDKKARNVKYGIVTRDESFYLLYKIIFNNIYVLIQ